MMIRFSQDLTFHAGRFLPHVGFAGCLHSGSRTAGHRVGPVEC